MTPFRSAPAGYVARWEDVEREVLGRVARDVAELVRAESGLEPGIEVGDGVAFTGVARVPQDPAVQRLLPDAHDEDADVATEFRHLTQTDLAAGKVARLLAFADAIESPDELPDDPRAGAEVVVPRESAQEFAGALTDVRLVLAERLGLVDDADVETLHDDVLSGVDEEDEDTDDADDTPDEFAGWERVGLSGPERRYWGGVFVAAGFAQESLVDEMLADLRAGRADG
ncbi:DUF2017 family protein [Krasilnikoviella flava]|uniref:Uncharacterized protein n=1 Tax=Krasilnikoviella flava TaxID=526729 RepID=A0A1T5LPE5_9MICO|nr:DUF2017 family protein [Krasilnikoviella flava]SKC77853.1 protein of unknown function [Krasilnikoviella flava]